MRTKTAQTLYRYWNSVRGRRFAPRRFEIEPARISDLLPETFILERAEQGDLRYRLAGTRICEQFATEFRGRSFFDGWETQDRATIRDCTNRVVNDGGVGLLEIAASASRSGDAEFEILLLPLTHTRDSVDRILGSITAIAGTPWLGSEPLVARRLCGNEIIWPEGRPHALAEKFDRQQPFAPHIRHGRIVRADRRQFRVYDGGLMREEQD